MKKHTRFSLIILCFVLAVSALPVSATESPVQTEPIANDDTAATVSVTAAISADIYDPKEVYEAGYQAIQTIAENEDNFYYWKNSKIIRFTFVHSFETGRKTMALFDILGENGQYGYMIYDCEDPGPLSYAAAESIFRLCDTTLSSSAQMRKVVGLSTTEEVYYFYYGLSFGCGVLHADGTIDIYNIRDIVANQAPACITKNSFTAVSAVVAEKKQTTCYYIARTPPKYLL